MKMENFAINIKFPNHEKILSEINSFFEESFGFGIAHTEFYRIEELFQKMRENISFVLEYPYIDKHHLDCYSTYFSTKFGIFQKDCIRVHIFEKDIEATHIEKIYEDTSINLLKKSYLGFFILRPLSEKPLGRSLISPKAFANNNFYCCIMQQKVSLCGIELNVDGFPHVAQDGEMHTCAESAIWSLVNYYSSKYENYKYISPSEVLNSSSEVTQHRSLPSIGLNVGEIALCLKSKGFHCVVYNKDRIINITLREVINLYIESGIPVLIVIATEKAGHAVLAIGHVDEKISIPEKKVWEDVCGFDKGLVFIDDNKPPYQLAKFDNPTEYYEAEIFKDMNIQSMIVPMPRYVYLEADHAMSLVREIFETGKTALSLTNKKWLTRLLLTRSRSYKSWIVKEGGIAEIVLKKILMLIKLPEFVWICEIYTGDGYENENASGLLILDATGNVSLSSVLFYCLEKELYSLSNDRTHWENPNPLPNAFTIKTYKHNLKGEWS